MDHETETQINTLEERIRVLQEQVEQERAQADALDERDHELEVMRHERAKQQQQIANLNELLLSHANIIKQLQLQVVTLSPKEERAREEAARPNPTEQQAAAQKIQANWKGHQDRVQYEQLKQAESAAVVDQAEDEAAAVIQGFFKANAAKQEVDQRRGVRENSPDPFAPLAVGQGPGAGRPSSQCSNGSRGSRRDQYKHVVEDEAAQLIQTTYKTTQAKQQTAVLKQDRVDEQLDTKQAEAALVMQCAWRSSNARAEKNSRQQKQAAQ
eukprot:NODE_3520_length_882_cov_125.060927_g3498_i0.p1 GENE.NODE_3520_length_882_cov_125.060927_g3498_i0~~NODE_3520_length_882_cov_125.060927_g3498_i0.p1  ORF type:complete len:287 (-),score=93.31 NODE_3520_length_882_cov_125.060927_g3498_i0:21-827(-)